MTHVKMESILLQFLELLISHYSLGVQFITSDRVGAIDTLLPARTVTMCVFVQAPCFGLSYELLKSDNAPPSPQPHLDSRAPPKLVIRVRPALLLSRQHDFFEFIVPLFVLASYSSKATSGIPMISVSF